MPDTPATHRVEIAGVVRDLPLVEVAPGLRIAFVDILVDAELTHVAAQALAQTLRDRQPDMIVTPEAKSIPLAYALARELGCDYVTLRKTEKIYMQDPEKIETVSITAGRTQTLFLDGRYRERIQGKRVALVDDVVSTGSTLRAMQQLMARLGAEVVANAAIFTEGEADAWPDVIALGHLPVFTAE